VCESTDASPEIAVVADEEHRGERGVEPLHHVTGFVAAGEVCRRGADAHRVQVEHRPVRVVEHNLVGTASQGTVDGGVDLTEQQ
jgi:hypothetical protein